MIVCGEVVVFVSGDGVNVGKFYSVLDVFVFW